MGTAEGIWQLTLTRQPSVSSVVSTVADKTEQQKNRIRHRSVDTNKNSKIQSGDQKLHSHP